MHYCLPGVVDTWSTLLYNLLTSQRLRKALEPVEVATRLGGGRASPKSNARGSRFFSTNSSEWLLMKGYAERFEKCTVGGHGGGRCEMRMQQQPWWAFHCIEPRERGVLRGKAYSDAYTPWPVDWFYTTRASVSTASLYPCCRATALQRTVHLATARCASTGRR